MIYCMTEITMLLNYNHYYYPICVGGALELWPCVYQLPLVKWLPFLSDLDITHWTSFKNYILQPLKVLI